MVFPDFVSVYLAPDGRNAGDRRIHTVKGQTMTTGTVKFFDVNKGFGFIQPEDGGQDAFVHISAVERAGLRALSEGQRVSYELETGRNGKMAAANLSLADD